jgi:hypothetical protein
MAKFKVGERVKIIKPCTGLGEYNFRGGVGAIGRFDSMCSSETCCWVNINGTAYHCYIDSIVKYNIPKFKIGRYKYV